MNTLSREEFIDLIEKALGEFWPWECPYCSSPILPVSRDDIERWEEKVNPRRLK